MRNWNALTYLEKMIPVYVYYLPMRNWNRTNLNIFFSNFILVYYLPMRNWNIKKCNFCISLLQFTIYLWGIETSKKQTIHIYAIKFTIYLWGIETSRHNTLKALYSRFTIYLWGIETPISLNTIFPVISLLFTYEELKPGVS